MNSKSQESLSATDSAQGHENTGERRRFSPFRAIRKIFRDGRKRGKHLSKSRGNLAQDALYSDAPYVARLRTSVTSSSGLNRPLSLSHESVFSPEVETTDIFRSKGTAITAKPLPEKSDTGIASSPPNKVSQLQSQLRLRLEPGVPAPGGLQVPKKPRPPRPVSEPPIIFINGFDKFTSEVVDAEETDATMGNKSSKKEQRTKSDVVSTSEPAMEQPFEEHPTILKNKAARDRIAARPKNRRAATRRVLTSVKESDTASELDIPDSIFAPIENAKKPDLPIEANDLETADIKPEEPEDVDVKTRRKSAGPDTLDDAAPKTSSVKKSYSFKSPLGGGGNIKVPSLGDVTKVKLRKTSSNASSSSSVVVVKRTPSFERPQLRSPSKSKDSSENKDSPKVVSKGLAHKLSFGKKSKPEGYDKKENKKQEEQKEKKKDLSKSPKQERPNKLNWLGGSKTKNDKNEQKSPMSPPCDEITKALERRRNLSTNKQTEEGDLKM
uniref:Uncharacterized protein n=2 Tax=Ciona intestinalis TaxID=7719 RepID=F6ZY14_CIOIN